MNDSVNPALAWCLRTLLGGGLLLLLAYLVLGRISQPARRQRFAEIALVAALLVAAFGLAPAWVLLPLPVQSVPAPVTQAPEAQTIPAEPPELPDEGPAMAWFIPAEEAIDDQPVGAVASDPVPAPTAVPSVWQPMHLLHWLPVVYAVGSTLMLMRWLLGYLALRRLLRWASKAPAEVCELCADLASRAAGVRLLASNRVRVPFSFGALRPTIVVPDELCQPQHSQMLRWVLAHELAHLERRDTWDSLLFGLGQVFFFCLPWFWWLRRQVRLCQEYVADAAAAAVSGSPEDYAQFLVGWSTAPRLPAGVTGVSGHTSDLFRRIAMLLQSPVSVERRCPRRWSLTATAGMLGLAVLLAGVGLRARTVSADEPRKPVPTKDGPKPEPRKTEPRNDDQPPEPRKAVPKQEAPGREPRKNEPRKDDQPREPRKVRDPFDLPFDLFDNLPGVNKEEMKRLRDQMRKAQEDMRLAQEEMRRALEIARRAGAAVRPGILFPGRAERQAHVQEGRLGAQVEQPSPALVDQLDLPKGQGLVVDNVMPESPAAKAGLKPHDILLEVGGKVVSSNVDDFVRDLGEMKSDKPVDVVVLRKGKKETLKALSLPEAKKPERKGADRPGLLFPNPFGRERGRAVTMDSQRNGDDFKIHRQDGDLSINIAGKMVEGKPVPSEIQIQDVENAHKAKELDKVPERYREIVKQMLNSLGEKKGRTDPR